MTRKQPKRATPKPVEAWALVTDRGNIYLESLCYHRGNCEEFRRIEGSKERIIPVRIVPIPPKKTDPTTRAKRKEKKK